MTRAMLNKKQKAEGILEQLEDYDDIQIFCSDGSGVRPVHDLLSDDQMDEIREKLIDLLQDVLLNIETYEEE